MHATIRAFFISVLVLFMFTPTILADNAVTKIDGSTRYAVAVNAAKTGWKTADTVVLVGKTAYADALTAVPFAYQKNAPVLFTNKDTLSAATKKGLKDLKAKKVIIIGGGNTVSNNVATTMKKMGISVTRIYGQTRYDTASLISKQMRSSSVAIVANGFSYADAVAISPYAAKMGYPILLTNDRSLVKVTASTIKSRGVKQTIVIGGESRINRTTYKQLPSPTRVGGATRYDTAASIVNKYNMSTSNTYLSNGFAYADAVTGASIAAKKGKAFLFTNKNSLPDATRSAVGNKKITSFITIGGTNVISANVLAQLKNPVVGKKVFIDPGHGAHDSGAVGYGLYEKNLNLDVAKRLNTKLNNAGALTTMSRTSDTFDSLQTRVSKGASANADIFISVHANSNDNSSANGTETYYDKTYASANSLKLAQNIQPKMVSALGTRDRGVKTAGFYVIKYSKMPSVLLETGFVSSPVDSNILKSTTYKDRLASGISSGVSGYFR